MPTALLVSHPACERHDPGPGHSDAPGRLPALRAALRRDAPLLARLAETTPAPATEADLLRVHTAAHLAAVQAAAADADATGERRLLEAYTAVGPGSYPAALAAAGCAIEAATRALDGAPAFALSRPPGHHASPGQAMGFCLFNNVAVAIRRLQAEGRARRVLVVDWDAHHGNGTQDAFYSDPDVFVLSLHLDGEYPGTGRSGQRGAGAGRGSNRNVPLPHGTGPEAYRRAYRRALDGVLASFTPDLTVVSSGFDLLRGDPEGGFLLEPADLHGLATDLLDRLPAAGRSVVGVLEGGYHLDRIGLGLAAVLRALTGLPPADE